VDKAKEELKIKFLNTNWMDTTVFKIPLQDLVECVHFIHVARSSGNSVFVHCAQVNILVVCVSVYKMLGCNRNPVPSKHHYSEIYLGNSFGNAIFIFREFI